MNSGHPSLLDVEQFQNVGPVWVGSEKREDGPGHRF
jgi:hypothetical protein